ncbi:maleylpyruvate isomerase family mycothiol-dependent enzyme [Nakamurella flava]|uniref:Maleylpyruvate isomerase family mycothiol-dependent enzyme n=1 Tax=Nakamurella flava TaxID=2576308 RepID=A0A4U6QLY2_9ACTN|nr:maleylpyruvate isomerase family mycothiol-dependent enzyme [Nakamurella flava]TKV61148.1 maleylpyruvate isomerase family mycothiol-dependent enzyme [Nakamurella flava]
MDTTDIWSTIAVERTRLAHLLAGLTEPEWDTPSLCDGWRIRHVAAHVIMPATTSRPAMVLEMVRARGNFNRMVDTTARRGGDRPTADILADFQTHAGSRRRPPGTTPLDPLMDTLVHSQDIAIPLGRDHPMPVTAGVAVARHIHGRGFPFHAARRFAGMTFVATDAQLELGSGREVRGPVAAIVLTLTGRTALLDRFTGPGVDHPALNP